MVGKKGETPPFLSYIAYLKLALHVDAGKIFQRQLDCSAFLLALIDGKHQLQRIFAGISVHIRRTVLLDGFNHIRIQAGMSVSVDVAGRFLQPLVLLVLFSFVCKIPDVDVIGGGAAELDGAVFMPDLL